MYKHTHTNIYTIHEWVSCRGTKCFIDFGCEGICISYTEKSFLSLITYLNIHTNTYLFVCVYPVQFYLELKVESKKFNFR